MKPTNFLKVSLFAVVTAYTFSYPSSARPMSGIDMLDAKCTVEFAGNAEADEHNSDIVPLLERQLALTEKFDGFMESHSWEPDIPIGQRMSPNEASAFGNMQEQMNIGLLSMLHEYNRARDIRVLRRAAEIADAMDRNSFQLPTDKNSDDFVITTVILSGLKEFAISTDDMGRIFERRGICSFENALISKAARITSELAESEILARAETDLDTLARKYGKPLDRSKLNSSDQLIYDQSNARVAHASSKLELVRTLLFLSRLEGTSKLQREVRLRSQYEAPGDNEHINVVWNTWRAAGKISTDQDQLSRVLNYVNERIPNDLAQTVATQK